MCVIETRIFISPVSLAQDGSTYPEQDRNTNSTMLRILYADQCDGGAGDVHSHAHGSHGALHPLRLVSAQQGQNIHPVSVAVLRIHDIFMWIRIHGFMPLTNGSGSCYFRH